MISKRAQPAHTAVIGVLVLGALWMLSSPASAVVVPPEDDLGGEVVGGEEPEPPAESIPQSTTPGTTIPAECVVPTPVQATFVGTVVESDRRTARFQIVQERGGSLEGFSSRGLVDVDYAEDVRFLEFGQSYIVAAGVNSSNGRLFSKIRDPEPLLGSSQVVGLNSGLNCPEIEDAVRTLDLDGRSVESGVLAPIREAQGQVIRSIVLPLAWVLGILVVLATLRNIGSAFLHASYRYWNGEPLVNRRDRRR
jgi:hypothetical protein